MVHSLIPGETVGADVSCTAPMYRPWFSSTNFPNAPLNWPFCNSLRERIWTLSIIFRQGSNELDRSCSRERSSPVMLSAAKHLAADRDRPFASLRVTGCDESNCQGLCFTIEPCLNTIIGVGGGFPVGRYIGGGLHTRVCLVNLYRAL